MRPLFLFYTLSLFSFFSCQKEPTFTTEDRILIGLANLDLDCDSSIESKYSLKGTIGGEAFCHYPGVDGYTIYTAIGSTFTTTTPSVSTNTEVSNLSKFFYLSFQPDKSRPFPEERISTYIKLPNKGDQVEEFIELMEAGSLPFTTWDSPEPGVIIDLDMLVRTNPESDGHYVVSFNSSRGDQSDAYCRVNDFTFQRKENTIIGEVSLSFKTHLYFSKASQIDGFWRTIEADMVIPYTMPME